LNCPLCFCNELKGIYGVQNIPIFQNKAYDTFEKAQNVQTGDISLSLCCSCNFVFNSSFNPDFMCYDDQYQNEQAFSSFFQEHIKKIIKIFLNRNFLDKKIIEIGCGKGYFLEQLIENGFNVTGFDPSYEGNNPNIIKDYFSEKYSDVKADLIILRHTLEHIHEPFTFLELIAVSLNYNGTVYIEVPDFDWIVSRYAFWDICYEHCNYFYAKTLKNLFEHAEVGALFNGQYLYLLADLKDLRKKGARSSDVKKKDLHKLYDCLDAYRGFVHSKSGMGIWGAGAKGSIFVNLTDPERKFISGVVDINPRKQNYYIAGTGHQIITPARFKKLKQKNVLIMNENYYDEIRKMLEEEDFNYYVLGVDI